MEIIDGDTLWIGSHAAVGRVGPYIKTLDENLNREWQKRQKQIYVTDREGVTRMEGSLLIFNHNAGNGYATWTSFTYVHDDIEGWKRHGRRETDDPSNDRPAYARWNCDSLCLQ